MVDVPRRLTLSGAEKVAIIADRAAPGSHRGNTNWSKPSTVKTPTPQTPAPFEVSVDRLSVFVRINPTGLTGTDTSIPAWDSSLGSGGGIIEAVGTSVGLNTPDDGGIYFFTAGVYAINLSMRLDGAPETAASSCSVRFFADLSDGLFKSFDCGFRGGDSSASRAPFPSTSSVYYAAGLGLSGAVRFGIAYQNLDPVITQIFCEVDVQRIS